ncbi:MAG: PDZ domain-containing protein [Deltaproteobacteria bacterium]|nr:PDZ domain-containing protein [Deltaproteobacteria bacterium]
MKVVLARGDPGGRLVRLVTGDLARTTRVLARASKTADSTSKKPAQATSKEKKQPDESILADPAVVVRVSDNSYVLSPGIRDLAAHKPVAFTSEGLALPPGFNDDIRGFTMVIVKAGGLFDRMGLKRGDVLVSVNGMPLRDFADSRNAYKKLKKEERISLTVIRGGKPLTLIYEIRALTRREIS